MEKVVKIKDKTIGILDGRDCIYIDSVTQDDNDNLTFIGNINGFLASKVRKSKWIPYKLNFSRVIAYFSCEIDSYENIDNNFHLNFSSFNIVENSEYLAKFPMRNDFDKSIYKHYQVFTYDFVYNIIAVSYYFHCDLDKTLPM